MNRLKNFLIGKCFALRNGRFDLNHPILSGIEADWCECQYANTSACNEESCNNCRFNNGRTCNNCPYAMQCKTAAYGRHEVLAFFYIDKQNKLTVRYENSGLPTPSYYTWRRNSELRWDMRVETFSSTPSCLAARLHEYKQRRMLDTSL